MEDFNKTIDNLEDALSSGTINEGQYIKLMDMAKQRYEKEKGVEEEEDEDEIQVEVIEEIGEFTFGKVVGRNIWFIGAEDFDTPLAKYNRERQANRMWKQIRENYDRVGQVYRGYRDTFLQN